MTPFRIFGDVSDHDAIARGGVWGVGFASPFYVLLRLAASGNWVEYGTYFHPEHAFDAARERFEAQGPDDGGGYLCRL